MTTPLAVALGQAEATKARLIAERDAWRRYARKWENKYKNEFAEIYTEPVGMFVPITTQRELDRIIIAAVDKTTRSTSTKENNPND
jgi:hypothetical protein